jgi:hypothetical protein
MANRDPNLRFALLTDFVDAPGETAESDAAIVDAAVSAVRELNKRHPERPFFLLHRARRWNASERCWMGYERKRGKLADLNAMLRGAPDRFAAVVGDPAILQSVRYVITLDTDTQLPRDAALVTILRGSRVIVPEGDAPLEGGDELLFVAVTEVEHELRELLLHPQNR